MVSLYIKVNVKVVFLTEAEKLQSLISPSTVENCSSFFDSNLDLPRSHPPAKLGLNIFGHLYLRLIANSILNSTRISRSGSISGLKRGLWLVPGRWERTCVDGCLLQDQCPWRGIRGDGAVG